MRTYWAGPESKNFALEPPVSELRRLVTWPKTTEKPAVLETLWLFTLENNLLELPVREHDSGPNMDAASVRLVLITLPFLFQCLHKMYIRKLNF